MNLIDRWKSFVRDMNSKGIPIPTIRDPKTGSGSVTLSLVFASSALCIVAIFFMLSAAIAKLTGYFILNAETTAQIKSAFDSSFQFLIASLSAYLGRKMQRDPKGALSVDGADQPPQDPK